MLNICFKCGRLYRWRRSWMKWIKWSRTGKEFLSSLPLCVSVLSLFLRWPLNCHEQSIPYLDSPLSLTHPCCQQDIAFPFPFAPALGQPVMHTYLCLSSSSLSQLLLASPVLSTFTVSPVLSSVILLQLFSIVSNKWRILFPNRQLLNDPQFLTRT